jgi:hypothetical protein
MKVRDQGAEATGKRLEAGEFRLEFRPERQKTD